MSGLLELSNQELKTTMTNMSRLLTYEVESIQKHMGKTVSSTHHQSLPSSLLDILNHQRADSRSKKNYNPAACGPKTTFTER